MSTPTEVNWKELRRRIRFAHAFTGTPRSGRRLPDIAITPTKTGYWFGANDTYRVGWTWMPTSFTPTPVLPPLPDWTTATPINGDLLMRALGIVKPAKNGKVMFTVTPGSDVMLSDIDGDLSTILRRVGDTPYPDLNKVIRGDEPDDVAREAHINPAYAAKTYKAFDNLRGTSNFPVAVRGRSKQSAALRIDMHQAFAWAIIMPVVRHESGPWPFPGEVTS